MYRHKEAFALMWYQDETTGERERLWNSRDGVTPYVIDSKHGNFAKHVDFELDDCQPSHTPTIGDRIFVDLTLERAREHRRAYVEKWWDRVPREGMPAMKDAGMWATKEEAIESLARADYSPEVPAAIREEVGFVAADREGISRPPDIVVVDAAFLATLNKSRNLDPGARWRHVRRRSVYEVVDVATLQWSAMGDRIALNLVTRIDVDGRAVVVYRALEGGRVWVRPVTEFLDGRFKFTGKPPVH